MVYNVLYLRSFDSIKSNLSTSVSFLPPWRFLISGNKNDKTFFVWASYKNCLYILITNVWNIIYNVKV